MIIMIIMIGMDRFVPESFRGKISVIDSFWHMARQGTDCPACAEVNGIQDSIRQRAMESTPEHLLQQLSCEPSEGLFVRLT